MTRSNQTPALILSLRPLGENNTSVTFITPNDGVRYATLYGGPKSKLRSLVAQWNSGIIWLYNTPEKNQTKITDFEVHNYHDSFGKNIFKMYAASLASELAIKTRCAGSNEQCFKILNGFLDGMELCNEEQSRMGLLRFLWRYLEMLGIQPPIHACSECGKTFLDSKFAPYSVSYYNSMENSFICHDCSSIAAENPAVIPISTEAVKYLSAVTVLTPSESRRLPLDKTCYEQIKQIVFFLIENSIDQKLNSIETGIGIL